MFACPVQYLSFSPSWLILMPYCKLLLFSFCFKQDSHAAWRLLRVKHKHKAMWAMQNWLHSYLDPECSLHVYGYSITLRYALTHIHNACTVAESVSILQKNWLACKDHSVFLQLWLVCLCLQYILSLWLSSEEHLYPFAQWCYRCVCKSVLEQRGVSKGVVICCRDLPLKGSQKPRISQSLIEPRVALWLQPFVFQPQMAHSNVFDTT